jgi:formylglycine-generating enzyme required for sulfatase activity/tRNA A-37 threonylcarbamoyl transferase component Bud32
LGSGFHEGVTIPVKAVGASVSSIHTDATIVMPRTGLGAGSALGVGAGSLLQTAVQQGQTGDAVEGLKARYFGDYDMAKALAKGGMGEIHLARDGELEREVAVKVSTVSEGAVDPRFTKEARVLANLAHPNIVPIYNLGVDSAGRPFYSMKLVKGRTLQSVLNAVREGEDAAVAEFTQTKLLTIFRKVCDAMAFAHSKGVLHRDLKPENVMVGEYGEVLVMDWGLAKVIGVEEEVQVGVTTRTVSGGLSGDFEMTMEGEVMGTPQYMSPEQAEGVVAGLDERSDVYALGAILYAVLTYKAPIEGKTLDEVLGNVRRGSLSPMGTAMRMTKGIGGRPEPMPVSVPEALRAVVMKAMAREKEGRYARVVDLAADVDAYVGGFATSAEGAGVMRRVRLWVGRNRVLAGSAALFVVMGAGFTAKVVLEGRRASAALKELKDSAPVFAARAEDELNRGDFDAAERSARSALRLDGERGESYVVLGKVLQVTEKWEAAVEAFGRAKGYGAEAGELKDLTERLVVKRKAKREDEAREELFGALRDGGRQMESVGYAKVLGEEFWKRRGEKIADGAKQQAFAMSEAERMKRKDPSVIGELVRRLEAKMLPVPGTQILLSKTEFTVGEWKLYLKAEGYPEWQQPDLKGFMQTDEHPVVKVSWNDAMKFCEWLSKVSGKSWRLPKNEEWEFAVGKTKYPWGEYFPPKKEDGNYKILADGKDDPARVGVDGIKGTAPVGSFKANALGFYDLGGNVEEWMLDGFDEKNPKANRVLRGGYWGGPAGNCTVVFRIILTPTSSGTNCGFRVASSSVR